MLDFHHDRGCFFVINYVIFLLLELIQMNKGQVEVKIGTGKGANCLFYTHLSS